MIEYKATIHDTFSTLEHLKPVLMVHKTFFVKKNLDLLNKVKWIFAATVGLINEDFSKVIIIS